MYMHVNEYIFICREYMGAYFAVCEIEIGQECGSNYDANYHTMAKDDMEVVKYIYIYNNICIRI